MFFIMGITNGRKELEYDGNMNICKHCGSYCRYKIFYTYMCLTLFFIPVFKWSKEYFVENSCCGRVYGINKEKGKMIEKGEDIVLNDDDFIQTEEYKRIKHCINCGYVTEEEFEFCPKCGNKL